MKNLQKRANSPISLFYCLKLNKFIYATSLFAVVLGIFLLPKTAFMASITPDRIIALTNDERAQVGLNTLTINDQLTSAAEAKAQAILDNQVFDHTINGRKFSSWIRATGYQYEMVGENLAIDFVSSEGVVRAWMNSPEHRANLLENSYTDVGVGIAEGKFQGENTIVVAELFGDPLYKNPPIPANISKLNEHLLPWDKNSYAPARHLSFYNGFLKKLSLLSERQVAMY
jgi:Uncharacterized protein with SCP/PR1 domains